MLLKNKTSTFGYFFKIFSRFLSNDIWWFQESRKIEERKGRGRVEEQNVYNPDLDFSLNDLNFNLGLLNNSENYFEKNVQMFKNECFAGDLKNFKKLKFTKNTLLKIDPLKKNYT
ncbi:hypothetical protein BpHYR1_050006 [Brachionus plicatilis]|uniref:Uncharacterized protein n=1 Tax=Brachionus plicatilis TaxID=10195 RepID=A0A3M7RF00_BRAPC|nr:hypothetical protein BpHYR1_050006 [Brachionus plicatilis]